MDLLPLHIEYLLTRHDCVIVPGIGAFIATETEAFIDLENGIIHPRRRDISFNSSVVTDDGLLTHSIARLEVLSYEDARRMMATLIEKISTDLNSEGEASLGMIGRLVRDDEGLISFQPRHSSSLSDILPDIKLEEKISQSSQAVAEEENQNAEQENDIEEGIRIIHVRADRYVFTISKRAVHAAAMLITLFTIGLSLMIPINHDNEQKASVISIEGFFHHKVNVDNLKPTDTIPMTETNDSIVTNKPSATL